MKPKWFLSHYFDMVKAKNSEFDAEFESTEKVAKKFTGKKLEGWELLHTVLKGEKLHNSYCILPC